MVKRQATLAFGAATGAKRVEGSAATAHSLAAATPARLGAAQRVAAVFAHGAGAPSSHPWMLRWAEALRRRGFEVSAFDYPYMRDGKRGAPNPHATLVKAHAEAIKECRAKYPEHQIVLIGKSMGSRIGLHTTVEAEAGKDVLACVCLGYPFRGTNGAVRKDVLLALRTPVLFVSGSRDSLCPLDELRRTQAEMTAHNELYVVETGDHGLEMLKGFLKKENITQEQADERALDRIVAFVQARLARASDADAASAPAASN